MHSYESNLTRTIIRVTEQILSIVHFGSFYHFFQTKDKQHVYDFTNENKMSQ